MAFLPPEQQNQDAPSGATTPNPGGVTGGPPPQSQAGGSVGAGGNAPKAGAAPNTATPNQFGSSASNLQSYLTANAPQITNQANAVAGTLNNQYGQVSGDLSNAVNQFGQSVQGGYTAGNSDLVNQAAANPAGFVSQDPNNTAAFQAQYNDTYTGPQNFESTTPYGQIQSEVSNAVQNAGTLNTQAGLQNYFQGTSPTATQASDTLDALLVQGNPQANQTVQTAANQFQNLTPQFANDTAQADAGVTAAQQNAANAAQYAQNTINPVAANETTNLNNELTAAQTGANNYNNTVSATQQQANALNQVLNNMQNNFAPVTNYGFSPVADLANPLASYNPAQPISTAPTLGTTANAQDYATTQALQNLIGSSYQNPLQGQNASQAGTFNIPNSPTTSADLTQQVANFLQQTEQPAYQTLTNQLTNPKPGSDSAAAMLEAEQANYMQALNAADPGLAAYLANPISLTTTGGPGTGQPLNPGGPNTFIPS